MPLDDVKSQQDASIPIADSGWQNILNVIPVAAYTCDAVGQITYFNSLAESVWGRTPKLRDANERYCGAHRLYLSDGTRITHQQCWMALALIEGKSYHGCEIVIERIDGGRTLGMAYSHPVRSVQGEIIGAVTFVAELGAPAHSHEEPKRTALPFDASVAMIEVAVAVIAGFAWERSALH
jgi:two-component system, LuxR family, sensor kinase FixL